MDRERSGRSQLKQRGEVLRNIYNLLRTKNENYYFASVYEDKPVVLSSVIISTIRVHSTVKEGKRT